MNFLKKSIKVAEIDLVYRSKTKASERQEIKCSEDAYHILKEIWQQDKIELVEQFIMLYLNRANRILGFYRVSTGSVTGTVADPKLIIGAAIKLNSCGIIMSHNHPSGNLNPSMADQELTEKIKLGAKYFDIKLLDHLIIHLEGYYSFADEGLLNG